MWSDIKVIAATPRQAHHDREIGLHIKISFVGFLCSEGIANDHQNDSRLILTATVLNVNRFAAWQADFERETEVNNRQSRTTPIPLRAEISPI
ncbi:hypothetical protein C2W62_24305 [Candidatus Entotheonella serta]|nr:hypothetical protein C2W62_24305 [Candidatus Entotheonella serta]